MKIADQMFFIPDSMKICPCWVLWKKEINKDGKLTKCLYSANYKGRASSTNPNTWSTFEKARSVYERAQSGEYQGIGFVISDVYGFIFTDIDHCIDDGGYLSPIAEDIIGSFRNAFIEVSQSGSGLHILSKGSIPKSFKNSKNGVEMYANARFVALTGRAITDKEIEPEQSSIDYVFNKYRTQKKEKSIQSPAIVIPLNRSDEHLIELAMRREKKFPMLWAGEWQGLYNSHSEADGALCVLLAFWTDGDRERIERLFRSSGLYREKWERDDYRKNTIDGALCEIVETLSQYINRKNREEAILYNGVFNDQW